MENKHIIVDSVVYGNLLKKERGKNMISLLIANAAVSEKLLKTISTELKKAGGF